MSERKQNIFRILMIAAGCSLDALGFVLFIRPSGMITAGASGLGLFLSRCTGIPVAILVFLINALMLIVGYYFLGKRFAVNAALGSFLYPIVMSIMEKITAGANLVNDIFLSMIFGGIMLGAGIGLVLRAGSSSGGMDIPPLILNKAFRIPIPLSIYVIDVIILSLQATQVETSKILYGVIMILLSTLVINKVMIVGKTMLQVKIISAKSHQIKETIFLKLGRGVTMLKATTGYLNKDTNVVLSVISDRQFAKLNRIVKSIDPSAFMIVSRVSEVVGKGFKEE